MINPSEMHSSPSSKYSAVKSYQRTRLLLFLILAGAVAAYVSWSILKFSILSFDGAFNTQAAINFFRGEGLVLDYGENWMLQTGLPFQLLNGAFLMLLGRNFTAAAMGNLVFYWALFLFTMLLAIKYRTILPLLAFMVVSLMPPFRIYAFEGYGEIPALTFMLLGTHIIILGRRSARRSAAGWVLAAFGIATKLVLALALPPLMILSLLFWIKEKRKAVFYGWLIFLLTLSICLFIQYAPYEATELETLSTGILTHGASTVETKIVHVFFNRMRVFLEYYMDETKSNLLAIVKLILFIFLGGYTVFFFLRHLLQPSGSLSNREYTFIFLGIFCAVYIVWHMLLGMKPWYRMVINADILLFFSLSLLPLTLHRDTHGRRTGYFIYSLLCLFLLVNVSLMLSIKKAKYSAHIFECNLREGLSRLPASYSGFGYGWWQAPRWSFLAEKPFHNLYLQSALYRYFSDGTPGFVFFEDVNKLEKKSLRQVEAWYALEEIFSWHGFHIARTAGMNRLNKHYIEEIDFSKAAHAESIEGFFPYKDKPFLYTMPDAAVFLNNSQGKSVVAMQFYTHEAMAGKVMRAVAVPETDAPPVVYDIPLNKGLKRIALLLPEDIRGRFILYLLVETGFLREEAKKAAGIAVRKIALTDRSGTGPHFSPGIAGKRGAAVLQKGR